MMAENRLCSHRLERLVKRGDGGLGGCWGRKTERMIVERRGDLKAGEMEELAVVVGVGGICGVVLTIFSPLFVAK